MNDGVRDLVSAMLAIAYAAEHSARLIALGYMADLEGRLRMPHRAE